VKNHLIGFQLGGGANWCVSDRFSLRGNTKVGVYGNHISHHSCVGTAQEYAIVNDPGQANDGHAFMIRSSLNDVAFVGEIDLGFNYQFSCHWSAYGGYRAVAVTGVALTADQIPMDFADIHGVEEINSNGALVLHGAYAGLMFNY
ncbi:MAG: hypothetical protein KDA62_09410, partial [Planctomycetales bacterium]|nr:hypothetical protein [Planctomycetales bacterium]